ncbi:MAG: Zn-dependent hydrolase [Chloroflexi bacterium]|nr:Zn-dependent hydrolase [Chloroflexota bacterium]
MRIQWFGQSAFLLTNDEKAIFIDPFGNMDPLVQRGLRWEYPGIENVGSDVLLVTHDHLDHNAVDLIGGLPQTIQSSAGTFETPLGTVTGIASEHDEAAGTLRGANVIYRFEFAELRVCHFGDFGQSMLRPEQRTAIGEIDLLFIPVGGMATINGEFAARIVDEFRPRWVVPMHYRTPAISFLEPADSFLEAVRDFRIERLASPDFETAVLPSGDAPTIVVPTPPAAN